MKKLLLLLAFMPFVAFSQCDEIPGLLSDADELANNGRLDDAISMVTMMSNDSRINGCYNAYLITNKLAELKRRRDGNSNSGNASNRVSTGSDITFTANGVRFTMKWGKGGTFTMGATSEQGSDADRDEKPAHSVTVSDFWIGETEVTQALWQAVMGSNPSNFKGSNRPVEMVSWNDCQTFVNKLNSLLSGQLPAGHKFRLPTEAEWEYAARGGNRSGHYKYSGSNNLGSVAWYVGNSGNTTHDVKTKNSNELGIYDMTGNVVEWCQDLYGSSYYGNSPQSNPTGPSSGSYRVRRGGSWYDFAGDCRVSLRYNSYPSFRYDFMGLRVALCNSSSDTGSSYTSWSRDGIPPTTQGQPLEMQGSGGKTYRGESLTSLARRLKFPVTSENRAPGETIKYVSEDGMFIAHFTLVRPARSSEDMMTGEVIDSHDGSKVRFRLAMCGNSIYRCTQHTPASGATVYVYCGRNGDEVLFNSDGYITRFTNGGVTNW